MNQPHRKVAVSLPLIASFAVLLLVVSISFTDALQFFSNNNVAIRRHTESFENNDCIIHHHWRHPSSLGSHIQKSRGSALNLLQRTAATNDRDRVTSTTTTVKMSSTSSPPNTAVSDVTKETFRDKTVLLTGATGGLGAQLALQLAACGVKTLILSARNPKALEPLVKQCRSEATAIHPTIQIHCIACDLSDKASVATLGQEALKVLGGGGGDNNNNNQIVDVLIHCGGVSSRSNFVDTALDIDEKVMQINFLSGASLCHALVPSMMAAAASGGGKVIWISSVQGLVGIPSRTSYAASKFAVQGYCEALRAEVASSQVTVHCVSPGYIRTNLSKSALTGDGTAHGKMDATTENGADPKDVAVEILDKVSKGRNDFIVAAPTSAKAAIWLRLLCPEVLQKLLVKRFEKSQKKEKAD